MSCKINLQNGNEIPCWIKPGYIAVFPICLSVNTYIMLLRNTAAPTKICNINKSMNQEQGCVPDNKISYLFCFSTVRFALLEVKIQPCLFYTMRATVSEQLLCLGHQNTQNFRPTRQLLSCTDCIFPRQTPWHRSRDLNLGAGRTERLLAHDFYFGQSKPLLLPSQVPAGDGCLQGCLNFLSK